ncbi:MAG: hypothetical protein BWK76_01090 [Desulfobulbaceae bacterium A2]|nr:MAG: hypothetical protein BWK76_01090 [Desulfobulbaceae bacterium A2]
MIDSWWRAKPWSAGNDNGLSGVCQVGLHGRTVEIISNNAEARCFLQFLFGDLPPQGAPVSGRRFEVLFAGRPARLSLWHDDQQLYFGESPYELATQLVNEVLYECTVDNDSVHALHAAALNCGGRGIVLPGTSGCGKSSLAALLSASVRGCAYLTDELALLASDGTIRAFTRPLALRPAALGALADHVRLAPEACLVGEQGAMVPHRCLNPDWNASTPHLDCLIFPHFEADRPAELIRLSPAQACMQLMGCQVNARNLAGHGLQALAGLARQTEAYSLRFGNFKQAFDLLQPILEPPHKHL